jgi:hypothetical protein
MPLPILACLLNLGRIKLKWLVIHSIYLRIFFRGN